jgi:phage terminase large subunit
LYGGRGSAKSWTVADFLVLKGYESPKRILCTREIQKSIKDSVHKLLSDRIKHYGLESFYTITEKNIYAPNGTEFIFKGLRHNIDEIKSTEGLDYAWPEEAHNTSRKSLDILTPTVRKPGSQIIFTYNPTGEDDPVHVDFTKAPREDTLKIEINWRDNPWFPEVLMDELEYDKRVDYDKYLHKWEGQCVAHSEAQIFYKKWVIDVFETPEQIEWNLGLDFGFSVDPSAGIASYITDNTLYIRYECWGLGVEIDKIPELLNGIPEVATCRAEFVADSSRPDTISYLRRNGVRITGAKKGKGSIEDGIEKIRGFEKVIIHPDCKRTIEEFRNYKWKVDPRTDEISTIPEDKNNHIIDALRYSLERYGSNRLSIIKHGGNNGINQNNTGFRR